MTWTKFWDMHSGGSQKLDYALIFIEAPREKAINLFKQRFGKDPEHTTCQCCGPDYSIREYDDSLKEITKYHRHCKVLETTEGLGIIYVEPDEDLPEGYEVFQEAGPNYQTFEEFEQRDDVKIIRDGEKRENHP